jgi:hypothetical protein
MSTKTTKLALEDIQDVIITTQQKGKVKNGSKMGKNGIVAT